MREPTELELAYIAGFIDGEGTIQINGRSNTSWDVTLRACNTRLEALELCKEVFGGHTWTIKAVGNWREQWGWEVSSQQAYKACKQLLPYLRQKDLQASLLISFIEDKLFSGIRGGPRLPPEEIARRVTLKATLSMVNKRGVA